VPNSIVNVPSLLLVYYVVVFLLVYAIESAL